MQKKKVAPLIYCLSIVTAILILLAGAIFSFRHLGEISFPAYSLALLLASAIIGFITRGLARKKFFGSKISLHQSFSFDFVVESACMINPFMSRFGFEKEFTKRETSLSSEVDLWTPARFISLFFLPMIAFLAIWLGKSYAPHAFALGFVCLLLITAYLLSSRAIICPISYLVSMIAEGTVFVLALSPLMNHHDAALMYCLFNIFLFVSLTPFAAGFAEIAALPFMTANPGAFLWLCIFHIFRIAPSTLAGIVYFARYKFSLRDFFIPDLPERLHASIRPAAGWAPSASPGEFRVSIVIPAYNEEKRIPGFLDDVRKYLDGKKEKIEVLVVDDGSKDGTASVVENISSLDPRVRLVRQIPNQGKGAAVKRGVLEAKGDFVVFADADGATPIVELDKFLPVAEKGDDVLVGSRKAGAGSVERQRDFIRSLMGFTFYKIVNFFAVPAIKDTQCGFKLFRRDVAKKLFGSCAEKGWAFDVELLYLAQMRGFKITEIPVNWHEVEGSKVNPLKDSIKMFIAIFRIRRRHSGFSNET